MLSASQPPAAPPDSDSTTSARHAFSFSSMNLHVFCTRQRRDLPVLLHVESDAVSGRVAPLVQHCPGLLYPDMAYGHILAVYWSPDSSRLLIYNDCSCAFIASLATHELSCCTIWLQW